MGFFLILEWLRYERWWSNPKNRRLQKAKQIYSANYDCSYYRELKSFEQAEIVDDQDVVTEIS